MSKKQQAEGNILTFLRIRPSKKPSGFISQDTLDPDTLNFSLPDNFKSDYVNNSKLNHEFHFNGILPMESSQEDVFNKVGAAAVHNALDGFNSTIFAYGQTGSGKTFTITGGPESYQDRGIIPRAISTIFKEYRSKSDFQIKAFISYLELYNEQGYDLLEPSLSQAKSSLSSVEDLPKVSILEDGDGNFHLRNLSMHVADSEEEALNLLFMGDTNRAIAETAMNKASSRSHCIFTISMEIRAIGSDTVRYSKLHLVDLAGSERVAKTNSSGSVLTEAKYINTSLFFLEMVIVALYEKATKGRQHIPYRNSLMTSVLRDSLGGNCKTIMIATINPEAAHTDESLSTCRFAQRVSLIKNKAVLNEDLDPTAVIRRLKEEILSLREEISFLKGEAGEGEVPTPQEVADLQDKCRAYCDDPTPTATLNIGKLTLTKIKDAFAVFKNLVLEARAAIGIGAVGTGSGAAPGPETDDLKKQIRDLKSCLVQRDTEIAILVNMVKKNKSEATASDSSSPMSSAGYGVPRAGRGTQLGDDPETGPRRPSRDLQQDGYGPRDGDREHSRRAEKEGAREPMARVPPDRLAAKEERLIKRHLFGVPPPDNLSVLDDPPAAFEYFRVRIDSYAAIEENKEILRVKYADAKMLGEKANNSRNTINYLKTSIESLRRERALQGLESKSAGDGEGGGDSAQGDDEGEEERTYRRAIEQEKEVYKDSFEKLRQVKPEIEHIRKILEKSREKLQSQFDEWYNNLTTRMNVVAKPSAQGQTSVQPRAVQPEPSSTRQYSGSSASASAPSSSAETQFDRQGSFGSGSRATGGPRPDDPRRAWGTPEPSPVSASEPRPLRSQSQSQGMQGTPSGATGGGGGGGSGGLPPLTGNKEADEDIMAFYKAKEELLKRRAAAQQTASFPSVNER